MTNAQIIFNASLQLMKDGVIKGSGKYITLDTGDIMELPESIHTYATWKACGRQVKRGEKCKARFTIWKAGKSKAGESDENDDTKKSVRMFLKESYFFTIDQTEPIKAAV